MRGFVHPVMEAVVILKISIAYYLLRNTKRAVYLFRSVHILVDGSKTGVQLSGGKYLFEIINARCLVVRNGLMDNNTSGPHIGVHVHLGADINLFTASNLQNFIPINETSTLTLCEANRSDIYACPAVYQNRT